MSPLEIAISGGGVASLCLAYMLCKNPQFHVQVYEASDQIRDDGAAFGIGSNAQRALAMMSTDLSQALIDAGGLKMEPTLRVMAGMGQQAGDHMADLVGGTGQRVVNRGRFIQSLMNQIPDDILQLGKKLISIDESNDSVELRVADDSTERADAVIGCDGMNSPVSSVVLGPESPFVHAIYTRGYNHRVFVSLEEAIEAFGSEYCSLHTQHAWIGDSGLCLTDFTDSGKEMQVIAVWSDVQEWKYETPYVPLPKEMLVKNLKGWADIPRNGFTKIFTGVPTLYAAVGRIHTHLPFYSRDRICLAGDAAHTFPPFQGAGAGQAIEDAMFLSIVLGKFHSPSDIEKAFKVYNDIRYPRRSGIAKTSLANAMLFTGREPDEGLDAEKIREEFRGWTDNIHKYNLAAAKEKALHMIEQP